MAYSRDEIKQITDKVLTMCKADAVEVRFSGGERSATRFAIQRDLNSCSTSVAMALVSLGFRGFLENRHPESSIDAARRMNSRRLVMGRGVTW